MKIKSVPKITPKQKEILNLLYTHRFLTRIQIQALLKHKDKKTINMWLKDLRQKEYIKWIYDKDDFFAKTKPAIYYIGINGIRHFGNLNFHADVELRKRYREHERNLDFINRNILLADCCIELDDEKHSTHYLKTRYYYETEADYHSFSYYNFLAESEQIRPNLCISKAQDDQDEDYGDPDTVVESYLLEIFDPSLPRYRLRNRLNKYVEYLDQELDEWDAQTNGDPPPIILLVCATLTDLIYAKRRTRGLLEDIWDYDEMDRPHIRFTTTAKLREFGVLGEIWEEA